MSVIFSHALNAIKNNTENAGKTPPKATLISKTADNAKSILTRIKKFPSKLGNFPKEIVKKERDVMKVAHKLIKKPKHSIIIRNKAANNEASAWSHDLFEGPGPNLTNQHHRVFIRNLPEIVDSDVLKKNIIEKYQEFVTGIKVNIRNIYVFHRIIDFKKYIKFFRVI